MNIQQTSICPADGWFAVYVEDERTPSGEPQYTTCRVAFWEAVLDGQGDSRYRAITPTDCYLDNDEYTSNLIGYIHEDDPMPSWVAKDSEEYLAREGK